MKAIVSFAVSTTYLLLTGCAMHTSPQEFKDSHERKAKVIVVDEPLVSVHERTLKLAQKCMNRSFSHSDGLTSNTKVESETLADKAKIIRIKLDTKGGMGSSLDSFAAIAELKNMGPSATEVKIYAPRRNSYLKKAFERWAFGQSDACPESSWH